MGTKAVQRRARIQNISVSNQRTVVRTDSKGLYRYAVFASIQYADSLNGGRRRTGSVFVWDWKSGSPKWRWKETDIQPVQLALSPDHKSLAVGCTVALAGVG